jgi:homoserine O-succinyltransferase/O-acetyltransferase
MDREHPLVNDVNTRFDVPAFPLQRDRPDQFEAAGLHVLVEAPRPACTWRSARTASACSSRGIRNTTPISLLKEYKREVTA